MDLDHTLGEMKKVAEDLEKKVNNHQWFIDNMHSREIDNLRNKVDSLHNMLTTIIKHCNIKICIICHQISDDVSNKQCNHRENHCYADQFNCYFLCCNQCYTSYPICNNH